MTVAAETLTKSDEQEVTEAAILVALHALMEIAQSPEEETGHRLAACWNILEFANQSFPYDKEPDCEELETESE